MRSVISLFLLVVLDIIYDCMFILFNGRMEVGSDASCFSVPQWKKDLIARLRVHSRLCNATCDEFRSNMLHKDDDCRKLVVNDSVELNSMNVFNNQHINASEMVNDERQRDSSSDSVNELSYGPGIVNRLKNKYLSLALRTDKPCRPTILRKATSLEHLLEDSTTSNRPTFANKEPKEAYCAPALNPDLKRARSVEILSIPKRLQPLIQETEKPPADFVRQTKLMFEQRRPKNIRSQQVASKVAAYMNKTKSFQRECLPERYHKANNMTSSRPKSPPHKPLWPASSSPVNGLHDITANLIIDMQNLSIKEDNHMKLPNSTNGPEVPDCGVISILCSKKSYSVTRSDEVETVKSVADTRIRENGLTKTDDCVHNQRNGPTEDHIELKDTKKDSLVSNIVDKRVEPLNLNGVMTNGTETPEKAKASKLNIGFSDSNSVIFKFTNRKSVPDYVKNSGARKPDKIHKTQMTDGVFTKLPSAFMEDDCSDDEEIMKSLNCPPSPCDITFINDNILIDGKSSISQKTGKPKALKISFVENCPEVFEYPSESSLIEDSTVSSPGSVNDKNLANYVPKSTEEFILGQSHMNISQSKLTNDCRLKNEDISMNDTPDAWRIITESAPNKPTIFSADINADMLF